MDDKAFSEKMAEFGRKGGQARAKNLSDAERTKSARKAAKVRWRKRKAKPPSEHG